MSAQDDVEAYVEALRANVLANAKPLSGVEVTKALMKITDDIWFAGIDAVFPGTLVTSEIVCTAHDIMWLVPLSIELFKMQKKI